MPERKRGAQPQDENDLKFGDELPVLPIRNAVLFPGAVSPFDVGREKSVALVEDLENLSQPVIAIFAQKDPNIDDPGENDLYPVGAAARVRGCRTDICGRCCRPGPRCNPRPPSPLPSAGRGACHWPSHRGPHLLRGLLLWAR